MPAAVDGPSPEADPSRRPVPRRHAEAAVLTAGTPVFEHVVTGEAETFLWRLDDCPCERNVWTIHTEEEFHLVRNAWGWRWRATTSARSSRATSPSWAAGCRTTE